MRIRSRELRLPALSVALLALQCQIRDVSVRGDCEDNPEGCAGAAGAAGNAAVGSAGNAAAGGGDAGGSSGLGEAGRADQGGAAGHGEAGEGPSGGTSNSSGSAGMGGVAGTGTVADCAPGELRCADLAPEQCSEDGEWVATQAGCAIACLGGACTECAPGSTQCRNGAVQECLAGMWTTTKTCDFSCEEAACVAACTEGKKQCNGNTMLQECVDGEYVDGEECDYLCSGDACTGECVPDAKRCNPEASNESQICSDLGVWGDSSACDADTFCVAGECKPCAPGTARCGPAGPQLCSETGEWVNQGACAEPSPVCFNGECVLCAPGDRHCDGDSVERCAADGTTWEPLEECGGATPVCLDGTNACGSCSEGETQCGHGEVQICNGSGTWEAGEVCDDPTPDCLDSACTECDPSASERRCSTASSVQVCDDDGSWAAATPCTGARPLCREDLGAVCGCEEGLRRCRTDTVPEICQGGAWVADTECASPLGHCLPATGECVACTPGSTDCFSGEAHKCSNSGAWESLDSCAGAGVNCGGCSIGEPCDEDEDCSSDACVGGVCALCNPGVAFCDGKLSNICGPNGSWITSTCAGECLASTGRCVECLSGSEPCGTCNLGSRTCTNNQWGDCNEAVDLSDDRNHCGSCTTACASHEVCSASNCVCAAGYHGCDGSPACYPDDDVENCGSDCVDCTQPNASNSCVTGQCANTCDGYTFACAGTDGKPTCGSWAFESMTVEGWSTVGRSDSASNGTLEASTERAGSAELRAGFAGDGSASPTLELKRRLCQSGQALDLSNRTLKFDIHAETAVGATPFPNSAHYVILHSGGTQASAGCDFYPAADEDYEFSCTFPSGSSSVTDLSLVLRVFHPWNGDFFVDNIRFQ